MKFIVSTLVVAIGAASAALAQTTTSSPAAADKPKASDTKAASPAARTDVYHVHFAKSALGKSAQQADVLKKQDPKAPMQGHHIVLRHQQGDAWDYAVIEHLGTKATVDAARPTPTPAQRDLGDWHTDTYVSGPPWADFAREMGIGDDAAKNAGSVYVVSVHRPAPGQRDALDKMLNEPPDRTTDTSSGNVVMQHLEGSEWIFLAIARYNSWDDFAKNEMNSIAQTNKNQGGWFKLSRLHLLPHGYDLRSHQAVTRADVLSSQHCCRTRFTRVRQQFRDTTERVPPMKISRGGARDHLYFGERDRACVFTSFRCFSTTRRNSPSIVLKASWMTLVSGSCTPLSFCFSSATSSWPRETVTSIRTRTWFPL